jgi:hypothetical protein
MADQTIALQARAPQGNSMAAAIRQNSQLMNMMTQQAAAQRQTQQAQQAMDIARAVEERVVAAEPGRLQGAALERLGKASEIFRNALPGVSFGDVARTTAVRAAVVQMSPELDALLPSVEKLATDRATYDQAYMTADILANKRFGTAQTSTVIDPNTNQVRAVNVGGMPGASFSQDIPDISGSIPQSPAPQAMGSAPPPAMGSNSMARPSRNANTTPQDLLGQGVNPNSIPSGNPLQPMSMTTGGDQAAQQDLAAIVQTMMQTGVISQAGVDAMRAAAPGKDDQLAQILRENNIQIMPNEGEAPGMSNAVFRPGMDAMPQRQDVQYAPSQYPPTYGKDPMQAPTPGSATVPIPRVRGEAEATERGKQDVRVATDPLIAGRTKTAELQAQKDMAFPDAQSQFDAAYTTINNRLDDIRRFKAHPARDRVIGMLDAVTPNFGRARGAQELYNTMVAAGTFDALQDMRTNSPTGGALGNVSDADIRLLTASIGALGQSQNEEDFFASLNVFENRLKQIQQRLETRYRENYGYRLGKNFKPPVGNASSAAAGRRTSGGFTVMKVED